MAETMIRTHVVLPKDLIEAIDEFVGQRKRSAFLAKAAAAMLERERLGKALAEAAGSLSAEDYPEWETPEKVSAWVRKLREIDREIDYRNLNHDGEW